MDNYKKLESVFTEYYHLEHLHALAHWDEATMMPSGGGTARAEALSTLSGVLHQKLTAPDINERIQSAKTEDLDDWQKRNLFWMEKQYQNAACLPLALVKSLSEQSSLCEQAWREARGENNWQKFAPKLRELFDLVKESAVIRAEVFGMHTYDVLIDEYCPDFNQATIDPIFNRLKEVLPPLIDNIIEKQKQFKLIEPRGLFPIEKQRDLGVEIMKHIGFDFNHGRLDVSGHPFCGGVAEDVRLTTRYDDKQFLSSLNAICHETGHACYEQGLPKKWLMQPVGHAMGMAIHESQSLFIEMPICRSKEFTKFLSTLVNKFFGQQDAFTAKNLFHLQTKVEKGYIRVDADEVTYPLHVILRYEIERDLFNDKISIKDLPEVWDDKMQTYFGLSTIDNPNKGVLQDVHWSAGLFGYFPAYTLGRLIAAQLYQAMLAAHPNIPEQIQRGNFKTIMGWLRENVHSKGSFLTTEELLKQATGEVLNPEYFLNYIQQHYLK